MLGSHENDEGQTRASTEKRKEAMHESIYILTEFGFNREDDLLFCNCAAITGLEAEVRMTEAEWSEIDTLLVELRRMMLGEETAWHVK